jgi:hypothetical protein
MESARIDDIIVRLHKLQQLDTGAYQANAPTECAQQLFTYRLSVLNKIVSAMEAQ